MCKQMIDSNRKYYVGQKCLKPFNHAQKNELRLVKNVIKMCLEIIYISSSSCRAASTDIPDPLPPPSSLLAGPQGYVPYPH